MIVVAADTCFLFHLHQVECLDLLGRLDELRFVIPEEVLEEFVRPESKALIEEALKEGLVTVERVEGVHELKLREGLIRERRIGKGEAACLTLAASRDWCLASDDEQRRFLREAEARIGAERIISSPDIVLLAVRRGLIPLEEADQFIGMWAAQDYDLDFTSFSEFLPSAD